MKKVVRTYYCWTCGREVKTDGTETEAPRCCGEPMEMTGEEIVEE